MTLLKEIWKRSWKGWDLAMLALKHKKPRQQTGWTGQNQPASWLADIIDSK